MSEEITREGSVGADIRALRKARGVTLQELVDALGRSLGWLSQIERGQSEPGINDLKKIAAFFELPLGFFFHSESETETERGLIVRANRRRPLGNQFEGLTEELLSPDLTGSFETVRSTFSPGASLEEPVQRDTEELAYVVSGILEVEVRGTWHRLEAGDAIRISGEPHRWRNPTDEKTVAIWSITPPTY